MGKLLAPASIVPTVAFVLAAIAGIWMAREASRPEALAGLVYVLAVPIVFIGIVLILLGAILRRRNKRSTAPGTQLLTSGATIVAGLFVGILATPVLGLRYEAPMIKLAIGSGDLALPGVNAFAPHAGSRAVCTADPGTTFMGSVTADDVGAIGGVRILVTLSREQVGNVISIETGGESAQALVWQGLAAPEGVVADGRTGTLTFKDLAGRDPSEKPGGSAASPGRLPATISGTFSWQCGDWLESPPD
jgi:hypothetical protein